MLLEYTYAQNPGGIPPVSRPEPYLLEEETGVPSVDDVFGHSFMSEIPAQEETWSTLDTAILYDNKDETEVAPTVYEQTNWIQDEMAPVDSHPLIPEMISTYPQVLPRDRVDMIFSSLENGGDFWATRVEKTFFDGSQSIDVGVPYGSQFGYDSMVLQNIHLGYKKRLLSNQEAAVTAGFAVALPTNRHERIPLPRTPDSLVIDQERIGLVPSLSGAMSLAERWFAQASLQYIAYVNDDSVHYADQSTGTTIPYGKVEPGDFFAIDSNLGYWFYRNDCSVRGSDLPLTGVAAVIQLQHLEQLRADSLRLNNGFELNVRQSHTTMVVGLQAEVAFDTLLSLAYATTFDDSLYDDYLTFNWIWRFGCSSQRKNPPRRNVW
ncbi:MAG: hypothetical protein KDA80_14375 [Planctomycetaceae bacterium]|nr:hypothetical protein [Planctomycetaceae bacterium]